MKTTLYEFSAMGSDCGICLAAGEGFDLAPVFAAAEAEVYRIEQRYSRFRTDSDLALLNTTARSGSMTATDDETAGLLAFARRCHALSGGSFDITAGPLRLAWEASAEPTQAELDATRRHVGMDKVELAPGTVRFTAPGMTLDFGGIGKEYAADRAADLCRALGAAHGYVNLAGDIRVVGPTPDGRPWIIGIVDPRAPDRIVARVSLAAGAIATSGDYQRFIERDGRRVGHILDPRSGRPAQGLSSVSVIAETCLVAGSLATAAMARGSDGRAWLQTLGVRHIAIDVDGGYWGTEPRLQRNTNVGNGTPDDVGETRT